MGYAPVNLEAAAAFLRSHLGAGVEKLTAIGHGEWSRAYAFDRAGMGYVVRFSALDEDFRKDQIASGFAAPHLPIPTVIEIGEVLGGFYAISERAVGTFIDELAAAAMRALLPSLFAAFDAMRQADLASTSGFGIWGADGHAPHATWRDALLDVASDRPGDRIHGWRGRLATSPTGTGPFEDALERLRALSAFGPNDRQLVHSDLLNFNVLVDDARIGAVFDWGCAMYGDHLYDLAWFGFWQPWYPAWREIDFAAEAARHYANIGLDVPRFAERLTCCQIHIGLASQAYCAFAERWAMLAEVAARTTAVASPEALSSLRSLLSSVVESGDGARLQASGAERAATG